MNPRRILAVTVIAVLPFLASAVSVDAQQIDGWGVVGGINRATLAGGFMDLVRDVGGVVNPRYGFTIGGYALMELNETTRLRPELAITQRGVRVPNENGVKRREIDLAYLDLAALVRRDVPIGSMSGWVGGGPALSLKLSEGGIIGDRPSDSVDDVNGTDVALALEAGITSGDVDVGLRYLLGLSNISKSSDPDETAKNRGLGIVVGYRVR